MTPMELFISEQTVEVYRKTNPLLVEAIKKAIDLGEKPKNIERFVKSKIGPTGLTTSAMITMAEYFHEIKKNTYGKEKNN